ncbi:MAG: peptidase M22 [Ruminococcus sp.]|nr:peptidase M22 [Ruminococcus sp.]
MSKILGIDTSNYTTSAALLDTYSLTVIQQKKLLPVKSGEKGIRQANAVFHHTKQLPEMIGRLSFDDKLIGIGVSVKPRLEEGSYMPCFLVGESAADMIGSVCGIAPDKTSHQVGHILAAVYSSRRFDLLNSGKPFGAFHVSGGTTDLLICEPDRENVINIKRIGGSDDLKAGQAIDRCGVMLGLDFPCGKALEALAAGSNADFSLKPSIKGLDCSFSGVENKCSKMLSEGAPRADIAKYCLTYVLEAVKALTFRLYDEYGNIPVMYAGGVMSNKMIRNSLEDSSRIFCEPEFSCDNAVGVAVYSAIKRGVIK